MKVCDFTKMIDLETLSNQQITIIIPLKEKFYDLNHPNFGNAEISEKEKIVFNADESSIYEEDKYAVFGIEPCFKSEDINSSDYEIIDVRTSDDNYNFVYNEDGEIWIVIDFSI